MFVKCFLDAIVTRTNFNKKGKETLRSERTDTQIYREKNTVSKKMELHLLHQIDAIRQVKKPGRFIWWSDFRSIYSGLYRCFHVGEKIFVVGCILNAEFQFRIQEILHCFD